MKKIVSVCMFFLPALFVGAQFAIPEKADCEKMTGRVLLVALLDGANDNDQLNNYLKATLADVWKYSAIEYFYDPIDLAAKAGSKRKNYAIMYFTNGRTSITGGHTSRTSGFSLNGGTSSISTTSMVEKFSSSYYAMRICLPDEEADVLEIGVPTSNLDSTDIHYFGQQITLLIDAGMNGKDILSFGKTFNEYSKRKLYINKAMLSEKGIEMIKKATDRNFEIVSPAEYEKLVLEHNQEGLYAKVVFCQEMKMNVIAAVEIKTGRIYARASHVGADCKTTFMNGTNSSLDLSFTGMCAKQIINALYTESEQTKKYNFR